ncbi:MAG TPA: TolC family protein [Pirellulales bacterium]
MKAAFGITTIALLTALAMPGCRSKSVFFDEGNESHYRALLTRDTAIDKNESDVDQLAPEVAPLTLSGATPQYRDITLQEAVEIGLSNSRVMRDLGGTVLRSPSTTRSIHTPGLVETDPRFGVDAALSAFDANVSTTAFWEGNHRLLNNSFFGGGTRDFVQHLMVFQKQISKQSITGATFTFRHNTDFDDNNAPANQFPSAWNTNFEAEVRQPILQGAGARFNRIAGPNGTLGIFNGVVLAKLNTEISMVDFEQALPAFVSDIENAYWDLQFAYRDLNAKIAARDVALETWRRIHALYVAGRAGGEAEKESQAREQYFGFQEDVQNALSGFRAASGAARSGGVYTAERRLRLMIGLPINDGDLLRPVNEPALSKVIFDWDQVQREALARRAELRKQRLLIKRREMELIASRNFLLPRLDTIARYRLRGFGNDLMGDSLTQTAYSNLATTEYQEWHIGFEFSAPLGFRRGNAAVRNSQLQLARERAILYEQEREVLHEISDALGEVDRSYAAAQTNMNRRLAAGQHLTATQAAFDSGKVPVDAVLYAQVRLADAESRYARAVIDYAVAVKNVHLEKGSLLDYNDIVVAGNPKINLDDKRSRTAGARELWDRINYAFSPGDKSSRTLAGGSDATPSRAAANQATLKLDPAALPQSPAAGAASGSTSPGSSAPDSTAPVETPQQEVQSGQDAASGTLTSNTDSEPLPTLAPTQASMTATTSPLLH